MEKKWLWDDWINPIPDTLPEVDSSNFHQKELALAVENNNSTHLKHLLETGGGISLTDAWNRTLIHFAVARNRLKALEVLLNADGAPIDAKDSPGGTALLNALGGHKELAAIKLIQKGANINVKDRKGNTPLFQAISNNCLKVCQLLLEMGVDPDVANYVGTTPLERELNYLVRDISSMNPHYLKLFMELFEDVLRDIILSCDFFGAFNLCLQDLNTSAQKISRAIENMTFLVNSHLSACVVRSINKRNTSSCHRFRIGSFFQMMGTLNDSQTQKVMIIISQLLTQGVRIDHFDAGIVYMKFGFCSLFKQMILMDIRQTSMPPRRKLLMSQLIYDVQLTIENFFLNSDQYVSDSLDIVLEHFCHHRLNEFLLHMNDKFKRKAKELPEVPLLIELARNEARKHLVDFYNIKNYGQLKFVLEMLQLPEMLNKLLTYEKKLYI